MWIKYGWSRGHEPAGNKFLQLTESIIICHWNAFIIHLDLIIMIPWGLIWAFSFLCSLCATLTWLKQMKGKAFSKPLHLFKGLRRQQLAYSYRVTDLYIYVHISACMYITMHSAIILTNTRVPGLVNQQPFHCWLRAYMYHPECRTDV